LIYVFENYSLDPDRRELRRGGEVVDVEPQVFDLLHYLIHNRERVVGKDDLIAAIWSGRAVSESAEHDAGVHCADDKVVWASTKSHLLYLPGDKHYGHTKGGYVCESKAEAAGYHPPKAHT
jgi:DNA-binding response OmpR family regulator